GEHPVAIVLLLVIPARPVKGPGDEGGQHGFNPERYSILQGHTLAWQYSLRKLTLSPACNSAPRAWGRAPITLPVCARVSFPGLLDVAASILGDLSKQTVTHHRSGLFSSDVPCGCILIAMFYEQPCGSASVSAVAAGVDQHPGALQLAAMERELQLSGVKSRLHIGDFRDPGASVPEHHRSAAVFTGRNHALEIAVLQRMVLGSHHKPLH